MDREFGRLAAILTFVAKPITDVTCAEDQVAIQ